MKLIIFGSTGGTGSQIVRQALENDHDITAFARKPEKLGLDHPRLTLVEGDVLDLVAVEQAIQGHDAVLCSLGAPVMDRKQLRSCGTRNIIHAMEKAGVKRFICQSGLGCGDSHDLLPFHYKYLIFPLMLRYVYADHEIQERYIRESNLEWTIIRPAALTNGKRTDSYWHGFKVTDKPLTIKISRADVAGFMMKQLEDDTYIQMAPGISY